MFGRFLILILLAGSLLRAETVDTTAVQPYEEESWMTSSKLHMYLGIGAVASGVVAGLSAPDGESGTKYEVHRASAYTAVVLAGAAVGTGLAYHWDDINLEYGSDDPDNIHFVLGTGGALMMLAAVATAPGGEHPGLGMAGLAAMAISIKVTW